MTSVAGHAGGGYEQEQAFDRWLHLRLRDTFDVPAAPPSGELAALLRRIEGDPA